MVLAQVIWAEARGESKQGKCAVAHVVLNRVKDRRFPNTVQAVATQPGQFALKRGSGRLWDECIEVANDPGSDPTGGALYFATYKAWPKKIIARIGRHLFFR